MPDILVRDLTPDTIEKLKARARQHGRSLQGEVKVILEGAVGLSLDEARLLSEKWQERLAGGQFSDSAESVREDRQR